MNFKKKIIDRLQNKERGPRVHLSAPYEDDNIIIFFIGDLICTKYSKVHYHKNPGYNFVQRLIKVI